LHSVTQTADVGKRRRALRIAWTSAAALLAAAVLVPLPYDSVTQAVVWLPEQAHVRVETDGVVQRLQAHDGESIAPGQLLAVIEDPLLLARQAEAVNRRVGLNVRYFNALQVDPVRAQSLLQAIDHADAEVARIDERIGHLQVKSPAAGRLVLLREQDLPGSYLKNGQLLGYVFAPGQLLVRAVVGHEDAALILERARHADVWFGDRPGAPVRGELRRDAPGATFKLPSAALSDRNGGTFATDPAGSDHLRTLQAVFAIDIVLPPNELQRIGGRAWVRFDLGSEALAFQGMRAIRQLLLKHFAAA
jgi:putative peptide zinc metalloprotease protein